MSTATEIKTHDTDESSEGGDKVLCGICRRQFSRYTCPTCNVAYCSLTCFRSEAHSQCSETFYRKEIETGIKTESSKTAEERVKMLELLKRMEERNAEEDEAMLMGSDEEDEEGDGLARRLAGMDISSASADELLRLLTKEERDKFFMALKDPSSELAQQLLASTELDRTRQAPWWEVPSVDKDSSGPVEVRYGHKPELMDVPKSLVKPNPNGPTLLYNICAVLLAYAYTTRHLSMSPLSSTENDPSDQNEARRIIAQAVPFIADRKSKVLHVSIGDAANALWSRLDPGCVDTRTFLVLLEDIAKLVRPRIATIAEPSASGGQILTADHPSAAAILALSDCTSLFKLPAMDSSRVPPRQNNVTMKLTFYAAHLLSTPLFLLRAIADEVCLYSKTVEKEIEWPSERSRRP
ncbi:hypothetical protein HYDPIDRAFT_101098 [Hydnomerulius pinastri MD-312]|uniref:HIT-type domain-containing protein n=1 Tax=Hydnomerulius pinastri MD-312 TaxID=994086 RepID=A0A0C9W099_9AGAM|nr:hypothetical protein HYDPIDRAFT_101098 [Hydnomerulius pinastri MD-312]